MRLHFKRSTSEFKTEQSTCAPTEIHVSASRSTKAPLVKVSNKTPNLRAKLIAPPVKVCCSFAACKHGDGHVSVHSAWHCSLCTRPFHSCHFNVKKGSGVVCSEFRVGGKRATDTRNFSMGKPPSRNDPPPGRSFHDHINASPTVDFRSGQGSPLLAVQPGSFLKELQGAIVKMVNPLAEKGVCAQTRAEHVRMLKLLAAAPPDIHHWPMARIALEVLEKGRKKNTWCFREQVRTSSGGIKPSRSGHGGEDAPDTIEAQSRMGRRWPQYPALGAAIHDDSFAGRFRNGHLRGDSNRPKPRCEGLIDSCVGHGRTVWGCLPSQDSWVGDRGAHEVQRKTLPDGEDR